MYRQQLMEKCGEPVLSTGRKYVNPYNSHDVLQTMDISYTTLEMYRSTHSRYYLFFMFLVLLVWYISILNEMRDVILLWDFIVHFQVNEENPFLSPAVSASLSEFGVSVRRRFRQACSAVGLGAEQQDEGDEGRQSRSKIQEVDHYSARNRKK